MYDLTKWDTYITNIEEDSDNIKVMVNNKADYKINLAIKRELSKSGKNISIQVAKNSKINQPTYAIMSGKGGVGKSYITSLFAYATSQDKKVLILDFDIYGYSIPKYFDKYQEMIFDNNILYPISFNKNLDIISTQYFIKDLDNEPIIWRGPKLIQLMELIINHTDFSKYDLIIIDTPPSSGDIILNLNQYFEKINYFVITTPREVDQHVSLRTKILGDKLNFEFLGFILNESYYEYNNEQLPIFGDKIDPFILDNLSTYLIINNDNFNYQQIEKLKKELVLI